MTASPISLVSGADRWAEPRTRSSARSRRPRLALLLAISFLLEGYLAKSFLFAGADPTLLHYAASAALVGAMFLLIGTAPEPYKNKTAIIGLTLLAVIWTIFSDLETNLPLNYVSTATFMLLILSSFLWVPYLCAMAGVPTWRLVLYVMTAPVLLSLVMFVATPNLAIDVESGRLAGAFISVAVACDIFYVVAVFGAFAVREGRTLGQKQFFTVVVIIAVFLEYMTRTRSSLAEIFLCLYVIGITKPDGKIVLGRLIPSSIAMAVLAVGGVLAFFAAGGDTETQAIAFRANVGFTSSRDNNWDFAMERIAEKPTFGEGLLAKQTAGGNADIDLNKKGGNYDSRYDPHSLVLSLAVQGGLPFMLLMMSVLVGSLAAYVRRVGLATAMATPEFVISAVTIMTQIFAGGDFTSFGNLVDRINWMFLGALGVALSASGIRSRRSKTGPVAGT